MGKGARAALTLLAIGAFGALLYGTALSHSRVRCEVCMEFEGRSDCRASRGQTREDAIQDAVGTACAILAGGVNETIQCNHLSPTSIRCDES
jgi:hypothetical protein